MNLQRFAVNLQRFARSHPEIGVLSAFCVFAVFFSIVGTDVGRDGSLTGFATVGSITGMLTTAAEVGIIAVGVSFLMISGEFDISVGSVLLFAAYIFILLANAAVPPVVAFGIALIACGGIGLLNAFVTLKLGIPSFITTLGALMFWRGIVVFSTGGNSITYYPPEGSEWFSNLLCGRLFDSSFFTTIIWFVLLAVIFQIVLRRTRYGNWVYATGGNAEAARNVGVPVFKVKTINFVLCATLAGFCGIANVGRYGTVEGQLGMLKELDAIASAVIGGNLLTGGRGSILGTFIGAVFMSMLHNGLNTMSGFMGMRDFSYLHMPLTGVIIVLAVIINRKIVGLGK